MRRAVLLLALGLGGVMAVSAAGAEPFDAAKAVKEAGLDYAQQSVKPKPPPIRVECERDTVDRDKIICH